MGRSIMTDVFAVGICYKQFRQLPGSRAGARPRDAPFGVRRQDHLQIAVGEAGHPADRAAGSLVSVEDNDRARSSDFIA